MDRFLPGHMRSDRLGGQDADCHGRREHEEGNGDMRPPPCLRKHVGEVAEEKKQEAEQDLIDDRVTHRSMP